MTIDARAIGGHVAALVWVALRSFAGTLAALTLAGVVMAGVSFYVLREPHWAYGAVGAAVALAEAVTTGVVLGAKRAVAHAVAHGLGTLRLGGALVRLVFERMLGVADGAEGGRVSRGLGRLPLAAADAKLTDAVRGLLGDAEGGWLRRTIRGRLLELVRKYTLARFRAEGAEHGGVDLMKVRHELVGTVDDALAEKVRGGVRAWTWLVVLGLPAAVAVQTWVALLLLQAK